MENTRELDFIGLPDDFSGAGGHKEHSGIGRTEDEVQASVDLFCEDDPGLQYRVSQSAIKDLAFDHNLETKSCPRRFVSKFIMNMGVPPTESMNAGNFFETLVLGSNRDGSMTTDLERTAKGQKTTDQLRIEEQAAYFLTNITKEYQMDLKYKHVSHEFEWNGVPCIAHIDVISSIYDPTLSQPFQKRAIIDTKLTKDISSDYGDYTWNNPERMDHTQAVFYTVGFEQVFKKKVNFYYVVMEYGPKKRWSVIRKRVTDQEKEELFHKTKRTYELAKKWFNEGRDTGVEAKPSFKECTRCPLSESCDKYRIGKSVMVI